MKPKSLILTLLISITLLASCMKDHNIQPVRYDLPGMWASTDHTMTWVIENTEGIGFNVRYKAINKSDGRYLQVDVDPIKLHELYKVDKVDKATMVLVDSKGIALSFDRIR